MNRYYFATALLFATALGSAQALIIPQIADGGGWQTTIVLTNTTASTANAGITFYQDTGAGNTQTWNPPFLETGSTQSLSLAPAGTMFLHTSGTAGPTTVGWAQVQADSGVVAYAIFTSRSGSGQTQDGTAPAVASSSRVLVPFDNTNGFVTSLAIANPTSSSESITVGIQPSGGGASLQAGPIQLPAQGHSAVSVPGQFPSTNGQSGLLEFSSATGSVSAVALRFDPSGSFTAAPVYSGSGAGIIGGAGGGGTTGGDGGISGLNDINVYNLIFATSSQKSAPTSDEFGKSVPGEYFSFESPQYLIFFLNPSLSLLVSFNSLSLAGSTFTYQGLVIGQGSVMLDATGLAYPITSASIQLTLSPNGAAFVGKVRGTFSFVSSLATLTGTITGDYTAN
jgi:hypothetical protein